MAVTGQFFVAADRNLQHTPETGTNPHQPAGTEPDEPHTPARSTQTGPLTKRTSDVLAYFDRPGTSNGPTEAINGRLEHLRGSALGFRNLTNYVARSLLETGGFRPQLHPRFG